jgi:hypothetical protein
MQIKIMISNLMMIKKIQMKRRNNQIMNKNSKLVNSNHKNKMIKINL